MHALSAINEKVPLEFFGAGGLARELASALLKSGVEPNHIRFVVDEPYYSDSFEWHGISMRSAADGLEGAVLALGDLNFRGSVARRVGGWEKLRSLVIGDVGSGVSIGSGSIVAAGARITCDVSIGSGSLIQMDTTVAHDCVIGSEVNVNPGARLNGGVVIGDRVLIGSQSCIREGIEVCSDSIIGMGTVVVKNIKEPGVYAGNPARRIK